MLMSNIIPTLFKVSEGNLLIRLLLAHIASDFILQNKYLVGPKHGLSKKMLVHIAIVFICNLTLSMILSTTIFITLAHWFLDTIKIKLLNKKKNWETNLLFMFQGLHLTTILVVWAIHLGIFAKLIKAMGLTFSNYQFSLILLAYAFVLFPVGQIIKLSTASIIPANSQNNIIDPKIVTDIQKGGKLIGQFERLIILTFVLLNQYEAIGFLITGKSIIRFAEHNVNLKSEYVLVGTMMSYALAIITGVITHILLTL